MLEQKTMMEAVYIGILPACTSCGFAPVYKEDMDRKLPAVYSRDAASSVIDFASEKGKLRVVFSNNRIHLLSCAPDVVADDDAMYNLDGTYLMLLDEYDNKDVRSVVNEMSEQITETYKKKTKIVSKKGAPSTVSKAAVRGGSSFDSYTLASKLAVIYPELKTALHENVEKYGDFLCEDFVLNHANAVIKYTITENNPNKMKKLFTLLGEMYEDGTNECQSLIAVSVIGEICRADQSLMQTIIPYLTDTMLEPVTTIMQHLSASKSARTRLDNPPTYKPKKKKQGLMEKLMGGAMAGGGLQQ